ncbi:MAG: PorP/SprF family type IX secretion system membrane protein [Bacteroidota bacterium]
MRPIYLYTAVFFVFFALPLSAQDIHYSQFDYSMLNLNPAHTGLFDGDYRLNANQRTQWKSVTVPFSTFSIAADASQPLEKENWGAGVVVNHDIAGDSRFRTFQFNFTGSYFFKLKADTTQKLSFGMMAGITNRNLNYDALYFDNQYDGLQYDPSLPTQETFSRESRFYMNLQLGAIYHKTLGSRKFVMGGITLANILKPKQSYFDVNTIKLDRRFDFHASAQFPINETFEIIPSVLVQFQGKYNEIIAGSQLRYILVNEKGVYRALRGGAFYRNKDAVFLNVGFEMDNKWTAAVSYDINLSDLIPASNRRGGLEFSLIYILDVFNPKRIQHRVCPNYI